MVRLLFPVSALLVVLGVFLFPLWCPPLISVILGAMAVGLVAMVAPVRLRGLCIVVLFFLLGTAASARLQPATLPLNEGIWVEVIQRSGYRALVHTAAGRAMLFFPEMAPAPGSVHRVRLRSYVSPDLLPGELGLLPLLSRARATPYKVTNHWSMENDEVRRTIADPLTIFRQFEHGGLLVALSSGDRSGVSENTRELFRRHGLSHLIAISGLHVGMIGFLHQRLRGRRF